MIFIALIFITADGTRSAYRSEATFPTVAACEAQLAQDRPRYEAIRVIAETRAGRPIRMVAGCIDRRAAA